MIRAIASAKINLSLRVADRTADGLHRIDGIFQSIGWFDRMELAPAEEDTLRSARGGEVIAGWDNLAWRAIEEVRRVAGATGGVELVLDKAIPAEAGLGGGSADAAAALGSGGRLFGIDRGELIDLTAGLGSDVPFCFAGGTSRVSGTGDELEPLEPAAGFAVAVVVPPIELATGPVYSKWDELGGPAGEAPAESSLPPSLRGHSPLGNDLLPAALALSPGLGDWRSELAARWSRPVLLTGSGPTLFAFFIDESEAAAALDDAPPGARGSVAAAPVPFGWATSDGAGSVVVSAVVDGDTTRQIASILDAGT